MTEAADPPDSELLSRALAGRDSDAFEALVRRYQSPVRGWLRRLAADADLADDLAQETFIRAWQRLAQFRGRGSFLSWLMKLAYNEFLQARRGAGRYRKHMERFAMNYDVLSAPDESVRDESPDLRHYLAVLSGDEVRVMTLVYAYGLTHSEASMVTGIPLGTIKSHVLRGKAKIRDNFGIGEVANGKASASNI